MPLVHNGKSGDRGLGIWCGLQVVLQERRTLVLLGGLKHFLASRVFEVLSAVESGINGPHSGSDHRHCSSEDSHYDCRQRMRRARKEYPDANDGNRDSGDWRPKAQKQKYARNGRDQMGEIGCQFSVFKEMRRPKIEQNRARQHALKQKTSAGPAFGECGKQTLQTRPPMLVSC